MDIKQAFQTALNFEQKGHNIYEETSNITKNPIVAKTFRYLANQELIHIEEIKEYIEHLNNGNKIGLKGDTLEDTKNFFTTTAKEFKESLKSKISNSYESPIRKKTELSDDDIKAHETALELEQSSYDFYKQQYDQSNDEVLRNSKKISGTQKIPKEFFRELKNFFKWLMEQENAHYTLIKKAYDFIKDPAAFYSEEEAWMVDGG